MITFILQLILTLLSIAWFILHITLFLTIIIDKSKIVQIFAGFILRMCKIWEINKDILYFEINRIYLNNK